MAILKAERFVDYKECKAPSRKKTYKQLNQIKSGTWNTARLNDAKGNQGREGLYYVVFAGTVGDSNKEAVCAPEPPFTSGDTLG